MAWCFIGDLLVSFFSFYKLSILRCSIIGFVFIIISLNNVHSNHDHDTDKDGNKNTISKNDVASGDSISLAHVFVQVAWTLSVSPLFPFDH